MAEQSSNRAGLNELQVETENEKFTLPRQNLETPVVVLPNIFAKIYIVRAGPLCFSLNLIVLLRSCYRRRRSWIIG